jgi:triosephosphate isomerase
MAAKLVMGNWKMNGSLASNRKLVTAMLEDRRINRSGVALAAPHVYLLQVTDLLQTSPIALAAQDVSQFARDGAYTGEVSAFMLANIGCRYALVGHSERRQYLAEDNLVLDKKLRNTVDALIAPVLCVGETLAQREAGAHLEVIRHQLEIVASFDATQLLVAYEPVWAIGTGRVASLDQIREMHDCIKEACLQRQKGSDTIRVLYGGSVKADNAEAILSIESVDGALVGGASLDVDSFGIICLAADELV